MKKFATYSTLQFTQLYKNTLFVLSAYEAPFLLEVGLHLLIGPSSANLSFLRLLLLINIVSLSKVSNYINSGLAFGLHLSFGPSFGLLRLTALGAVHKRRHQFLNPFLGTVIGRW